MMILKSFLLFILLFSICTTSAIAKGKLKRYIVKRNGIISIEYHEKNPKIKTINHLNSKIVKAFSQNDSDLEYAQEDILLTPQFDRSDASIKRFGNGDQFSDQWSLGYEAGGIQIEDAWDETIGSSNIVVAVVDTGILNHHELNGRVLPGYDFISDPLFGNDGSGRDSDPSDTGDWVQAGDPCYNGTFRASSWHGTHVAGTIAANGDNSSGVSGADLRAKILPVRVLGKCGGYTSDIADGVRWAAGGHVSGVPNNTNPAHVINLSLGGLGPCGQYMQDAINDARSRGAVIVVAAGNDGVNINNSQYTPANCNGVISVASNNRYAEKSHFSNYGNAVDITAPGGGAGGGILSLGNSGSTTPESMIYVEYSGTSMSAPHVSALVSLIKSISVGLFPSQIEDIIERGAKSFGFNSNCNQAHCGAGLLGVVESLLIAQNTSPDGSFTVDDKVIVTEELGAGNLQYNYENGGGFCGSIQFIGNDKTGGGSAPLSLGIIFILSLMFTLLKNRKLKIIKT